MPRAGLVDNFFDNLVYMGDVCGFIFLEIEKDDN